MTRVRVADDFKAIRLRLEELCREPAQLHAFGQRGQFSATHQPARLFRIAVAAREFGLR